MLYIDLIVLGLYYKYVKKDVSYKKNRFLTIQFDDHIILS